MNRTPPLPVQRALRQEVGCGCPIPDCRKPFLTFHHFDPPWHVKQHHDPEGMIALCREHHDVADGGGFSKGELWALKQTAHPAEEVKAKFPSWSKREILVRLGGCYTLPHMEILSVGGHPVIGLARDPSGLLLISFRLRSEDGKTSVVMHENVIQGDPQTFYDLEADTGAKNVRVWFARRDIGLHLSFSGITVAELDRILAVDRGRCEARVEKGQSAWITDRPQWMQDIIREAEQSGPAWPEERLAHLPAHLREALRSGDPTGTFVKQWVAANCLDDEQKVWLLDFRTLVVHESGRRLRIKDGIEEGEGKISYCALLGNGAGALHL